MISSRPVDNLVHSSRLFIAIASAGFVLTGVVNTFLGPILPWLAPRWELSDSHSGYLFATQFLGSIIGVSMSSVLLPRRGFRFTTVLAYLLMAAGVGGLTFSAWRYALMATLTLGIGFGLAIPTTNLLISNANQAQRASALSILNFCWGIGAVVAPAAIYIAARHDHLRTFLVLLSALLFLLAASLVFTLRGQLPPEKKEFGDQEQRKPEWLFITIVGGMFFLYVAIEASVGGWIATLAERVRSDTVNTWLLAPSLFWGGLLAGRALTPFLLRRVSERRLSIAGLTFALVGMFILVISAKRQWIAIAGNVIGLGLAAVFPITIALLSRFKNSGNKSAGPMFAMAGLGGATMPWLVGVVSTWSGSLQTGLMVPLLATAILLWLHSIGNMETKPF